MEKKKVTSGTLTSGSTISDWGTELCRSTTSADSLIKISTPAVENVFSQALLLSMCFLSKLRATSAFVSGGVGVALGEKITLARKHLQKRHNEWKKTITIIIVAASVGYDDLRSLG